MDYKLSDLEMRSRDAAFDVSSTGMFVVGAPTATSKITGEKQAESLRTERTEE